MIEECRGCKWWHGEFLCACPASEYYHNARLGADWCAQWQPQSERSGEELLSGERLFYYHGMKNGFEDLVNAVREDTEPLTVDYLERLTHDALRAVLDAMTNTNRCICCGEIIPEGRQVCPRCEKGGTPNV